MMQLFHLCQTDASAARTADAYLLPLTRVQHSHTFIFYNKICLCQVLIKGLEHYLPFSKMRSHTLLAPRAHEAAAWWAEAFQQHFQKTLQSALHAEYNVLQLLWIKQQRSCNLTFGNEHVMGETELHRAEAGNGSSAVEGVVVCRCANRER